MGCIIRSFYYTSKLMTHMSLFSALTLPEFLFKYLFDGFLSAFLISINLPISTQKSDILIDPLFLCQFTDKVCLFFLCIYLNPTFTSTSSGPQHPWKDNRNRILICLIPHQQIHTAINYLKCTCDHDSPFLKSSDLHTWNLISLAGQTKPLSSICLSRL